MPVKLNSDRRHHVLRQEHRVTNPASYDAALRQRGSLTVCFTAKAIAGWRAAPRTIPGKNNGDDREVYNSNKRIVAGSYGRVVAWATKFDPRGETHISTPDFLYISAEVWILGLSRIQMLELIDKHQAFSDN